MADTKYQKVLQLYRSTNIWQTKNMAKAEVEIHAQSLHPEIAEQPIEKYLRDGEPIVAKYYDKADGYTFRYTSFSGDPYDVNTESSKHIWVEGFDSFIFAEYSEGKIKGKYPDYDSAAYIRVGTTGNYSYYKLEIRETPSPIPSRDISAVFGVALVDDNNYYIEWFDSSAEAKGAINELNYLDNDLNNGFVALANQKDGKLETIHGQLSPDNANAVDIEQDETYKYIKLADSSSIPQDYVWTSLNSGSTKPSDIIPTHITKDTPKYYHVTSGADEGYYELRKNVTVKLNIDDATKNILSQSANGLKTNIDLKTLTQSEINTLPDGVNVKEAYKLVGNANGTDIQIGQTIKIYKDGSLYRVYLGTTTDELIDVYAWTDGSTTVYTVDGLVDDATHDIVHTGSKTYEHDTDPSADPDSYKEVEGVTVGSFDSENNQIKIGDDVYDYAGSATPWIVKDTASEHEALCFVYYLSDGDYELVAVDIEDFINENEFGDGLKVVDHIVSAKLHSEGGLDVDYETGQSSGNKSLIIKIDTTANNTYYRPIASGESVTASNRYAYVGIGATGADAYGYKQDNNGTYVKDTYLETSSDGLSVNPNVLDNKITDKVSKVLYVNGEKFVKDSNGDIKAVVTGSDIKVAGVGSTTSTNMTTITPVEGAPVVKDEVPISDVSRESDPIIFVEGYLYGLHEESGVYSYETFKVQNDPLYIEINGLIYKLDDHGYRLFNIDANTTLNDATAILNYLTYNLDMGRFTI